MNRKSFPILLDSDKGRIFEAIQYDDSCPFDDLVFFLTSRAIPACISPLHDRDEWSEAALKEFEFEHPDKVGVHHVGEIKKPHRHVLFLFLGYKSGRQIKEICEAVGLVKPMLMHDRVQRLRYLCHFDDPDKAFYDPMQVTVIGNINYEWECQKAVDDMPILKEIEAFIRQEHILSYADLKDYCAVYQPTWYEAITKRNTLSTLSYLKSLAYQPKLETLELEFKAKELHDELDLLDRRKKQLTKDIQDLTHKKSNITGCKKGPLPTSGVVNNEKK